MTKKELRKQIESTAAAARAAGHSVEINTGLPYVAVDVGEEYFFQGEEASDLLDEAERASDKFGVDESDFILWSAQSW